jgi:hypothetical protein
MNNKQSRFDDLADKITSKVIELLNKFEKSETTKLIAICKNAYPLNYDTAKLYEHQKTISLGVNFVELDTYDKLVVIKSAIRTHYQTVNGEIPSYGHILYYELIQPNQNPQSKFIFDLNGKIIVNDDEVFQ